MALAAGIVVAAGLFAYWGTWRGQFRFDDSVAIVENAPLLAGDWWNGAFGARHQPLANRPLSCLSLALDFAVFGPGPFGPHLTNLLLHLLNGVLVFATARGALLGPNLAGCFDGRRATWLAMALAAVWVVHPLGGDAVSYATQRSTVLFSGCFLLSLLASLRAHATARPARWRLLAVLAMAASMACKEDAVAGPVLLVLFERAFLLPSWSALRERAAYLAALGLSWAVLAACLWLGPANPTVGYATRSPVTAWQWLMTQAGVVAHYLRLSLWPHPLRGAYDWPVVKHVGEAVVPGLVVLLVLGVAAAAWRGPGNRWLWFGWLGSLFFLLLAPTSTVMPIVTEVIAERRAYLPMLFVLAPVTMAVGRLVGAALPAGRRYILAAPLLGLVLVGLALAARDRVAVYGTEASFWADAYEKRDPARRSFLSGLIVTNHGDALWRQGRFDEANACYDLSMECDGPTVNGICRYATSLLARQRTVEAIEVLRRVVATNPEPYARGMLGVALAVAHEAEQGAPDDARLGEAEAALRAGVEDNPRNVQFWSAVGYVMRVRGRLAEAEAAYRQVTDQTTDEVVPFLLRAELLERLGRAAEVGPLLQRLVAAHPTDVPLRLRLADWAWRRGDAPFATRMVRDALALDPGNAEAAAALRQLQGGR